MRGGFGHRRGVGCCATLFRSVNPHHGQSMFEAELILKTTPPRLPRAALERLRFVDLWQQVNERAVLAVVAPAGFGKTTLMLQWRRLWLERGSYVAWAALDAQDEPARFARCLLHAMRSATGRAAFEPLAAL